MGEEEKEVQAQEAEAKEAAPAAAGEAISDEEFSSLLGESFGSFKIFNA